MDIHLNENGILNEMSNIPPKVTGISNVIIWIGKKPNEHWYRVKVSNVPNKVSNDFFTITIPEHEPIGVINHSFIKPKIYKQIIEFITFYEKLIMLYSDGAILLPVFIKYIKNNPIGTINPEQLPL